MAQMDLAAGNAAARRARGRCATVAVDGMVFHSPVFVGDEVTLFAEILRVGRTSMSIRVEAWRRSRDGDDSFKVTEATFTFVAIDEQRRPRSPCPPPIHQAQVEARDWSRPCAFSSSRIPRISPMPSSAVSASSDTPSIGRPMARKRKNCCAGDLPAGHP